MRPARPTRSVRQQFDPPGVQQCLDILTAFRTRLQVPQKILLAGLCEDHTIQRQAALQPIKAVLVLAQRKMEHLSLNRHTARCLADPIWNQARQWRFLVRHLCIGEQSHPWVTGCLVGHEPGQSRNVSADGQSL